MSEFWKRVDDELDFLGKNRTYLANKCDFSLTNFNLGIKRGSCPSADTAVKIASALGVTVEYLVTGSNSSKNKNKNEESEQLRLYRKHAEIIQKCEQISPEKEKLLVTIAENFEK